MAVEAWVGGGEWEEKLDAGRVSTTGELRRWGSDVESIDEGIHAISQVLVSVWQQSTLPLKGSDLPHSRPCVVHTILSELMFQFHPEGFFSLLNHPLKLFLQCLYFVPVTLPENRCSGLAGFSGCW